MKSAEGTINQRLNFLIDKLGMSPYSFSRALEVSDATIRQYTHKGSKPGFEILEKIVTVFDNVNPYWLLKGTGEVFINGGSVNNSNNTISARDIKGKGHQMGINNTSSAPYVDERCLKELEKTKEKLETVEGKYIALLEKLSMQG